jgi:hypothetical protein
MGRGQGSHAAYGVGSVTLAPAVQYTGKSVAGMGVTLRSISLVWYSATSPAGECSYRRPG